MKKKTILPNDFLPSRQEKLFLYDKLFNLFIKLHKNNLLPNKILITGQAGLGKSTFAYHFINFILSQKEDHSYDLKNFQINPLNKSFQFLNQHCHPNFFLIENSSDKQTIDIQQIRDMINYVNKTSFEKQIKFILVNNSEYLNLHSVNALLKIVEEPTPNTFFVFIHDSSIKLVETLKSRCIEFKISFTNNEKQKILNNLFVYNDLTFNHQMFKEIESFYYTPGIVLRFAKLLNERFIDIKKINLKDIIFDMMNYNLKNKNNINLKLLQNTIELFFFKKLRKDTNKNKIFLNYSKVIKQLNIFRKYNIDMNNVFYEIKENIIHG